MPTDFSNYLRSKGYAEHVVRDGLEGLVKSWESIATGLAQNNPAYVMYDEFLNDMDCRRILRECMELAAPKELHAFEARVAAADALYRDSTLPVSRCVWGDENALKFGYTPMADWYYYRGPKTLDETWPVEFRERAA
jgi:hypothetical protein